MSKRTYTRTYEEKLAKIQREAQERSEENERSMRLITTQVMAAPYAGQGMVVAPQFAHHAAATPPQQGMMMAQPYAPQYAGQGMLMAPQYAHNAAACPPQQGMMVALSRVAAPLYGAASHSPLPNISYANSQPPFVSAEQNTNLTSQKEIEEGGNGQEEIKEGDNVFTEHKPTEMQYNGELEWLRNGKVLEQLGKDEMRKSVDVCRGLICVSERRNAVDCFIY